MNTRTGWSRQDALERLENPERYQTQDPEEFWNRVGLSPRQTVADVGAGSGFFALPAAQRVGPEGTVYAIDISTELVELLEERARQRGLRQLKPIQSQAHKIPLPNEIADLVLLANILHDIPDDTLREAVRLLKKEGRLVNVDWKKQATPMGPPLEIRLDPDQAKDRLERQGLQLEQRWDLGPYHYVLVLRKSS
jgi:ubiquinone/menaquinone biosynthesis C-methylase UbiE